ncbi:hypothetical protein B0T25DRAFT_339617 [Lasiosphaeria hispida]|uniref:Uncharacterized protein n=1 Tax=Lasiosphaeria hispida TaxID=260671 RepID=A0AAJ0M822_9PEZI|nr:hypothetical protein B0T25DRAFT_339617 [Lasiosphaeria hispida]
MATPDTIMSVSASTSTSISAASPALTNHSTAPSLGEKTTTIRFVGTKAFWDLINSTDQEILAFHNFIRLDQERELRRRAILFRRYDAKERILIVLIPGGPHEQLHLKLYREYIEDLYHMGLRDAWNDHGITTFSERPGGNRGEGNSSGSPSPQQPNGRSWPTLVIEAGDSSSLKKLREDMGWWFSASEHQVQIVLLAELDRPGRRIILEK